MPFQDEDVITSRSGGPSHNDLWTQGGSFLHFHLTFLWLRHCEWLYSNYRSSVITITAFSFRTAVVLNSYTKQQAMQTKDDIIWLDRMYQDGKNKQAQKTFLWKELWFPSANFFPGELVYVFCTVAIFHVWMYWSWVAVGIMHAV